MVILKMKVGKINLEIGRDAMFNLEDNWIVVQGDRRYRDTLLNCLKALNAALNPQILEICLTTGFFSSSQYRIYHEFWMED